MPYKSRPNYAHTRTVTFIVFRRCAVMLHWVAPALLLILNVRVSAVLKPRKTPDTMGDFGDVTCTRTLFHFLVNPKRSLCLWVVMGLPSSLVSQT